MPDVTILELALKQAEDCKQRVVLIYHGNTIDLGIPESVTTDNDKVVAKFAKYGDVEFYVDKICIKNECFTPEEAHLVE